MIDPECPIIDFYPEDFKIDLNGKKYAWQGVALLPFVDEVRLKRALESVYPLLTAEEKRRNMRGDDRLYVRENHRGFNLLRAIYTDGLGTIHKGRPHNFRDFLPPPSPLSAFHATYQYCLSAKLGDFSTPLPPQCGRPLCMVPYMYAFEYKVAKLDGGAPLPS